MEVPVEDDVQKGEGRDEEQKWGEDEFGKYKVDRVWSMNEIRDHPMFMEDVPEDISDNPHLLALQSLIYDGQTPEEMAEHFKKLGNEAVRTSSNKVASQNALMAYTKGLEMECKDDSLNSQLHSNRALVSMRLQEHARAVDDCRQAIKLDSSNLKAYYRGAKASETSGLTRQALKFLEGGLKLKAEDKELLQMRKRLQKQLELEEKQHLDRARAEDSVNSSIQRERSQVEQALDARDVRLGPILYQFAMYFKGKEPSPVMEDGGIQWPMILLYDETSQSDFVEVFDERCSLRDQFEIMFPEDRQVDWDFEAKYKPDRLIAYLEHYEGLGNKSTVMRSVDTVEPLQKALQGLRVPQVLAVHVLVGSSGAHESFCREHHLPLP